MGGRGLPALGGSVATTPPGIPTMWASGSSSSGITMRSLAGTASAPVEGQEQGRARCVVGRARVHAPADMAHIEGGGEPLLPPLPRGSSCQWMSRTTSQSSSSRSPVLRIPSAMPRLDVKKESRTRARCGIVFRDHMPPPPEGRLSFLRWKKNPEPPLPNQGGDGVGGDP